MNFDFDPTVTVNFVLSAGVILFTWFKTRRKDLESQFGRIETRLSEGSKRMDALQLGLRTVEQTIEMMPSKDDHHRLELVVSDMVGEMKTIGAHIQSQAELMRRMEAMVDRHEDHLLDGGRK